MTGQIGNGIFAPSYQTMKVIKIGPVILIETSQLYLRRLFARLKSERLEDSKGATTSKAEARTPLTG